MTGRSRIPPIVLFGPNEPGITPATPDEAERLLRGALDLAAAGGDDRLASMIAVGPGPA